MASLWLRQYIWQRVMDDGRQLRPRLREMAQMWIALPCDSDRSADSAAFCACGPSCFHPCGRWRTASASCLDSRLVPEICQASENCGSSKFDWVTWRARWFCVRPDPHRWGEWHWSGEGIVNGDWKVRMQPFEWGTRARCAKSSNVP